MLRLGSALLLPLVLGNSASAASKASSGDWVDPWAEEGVTAAQGWPPPSAKANVVPAAAAARATAKGTSKARPKSSRRTARYKKAPGSVVADSQLRETPLPRPSGKLHLFSPGGAEDVKVNIYNEDGSYNVDALRTVSRLLRCKRTDAIKDIEPRLVTILSHVYDHFGERRLEVVSGYRNQQRTTSYHYQGAASDIRIPGVTPKKLRAFVETLDEGGIGIGLYPRSNFVHIDLRPPPSYRWIDYSRSDPGSPDKRPPRGWKRKKLQS